MEIKEEKPWYLKIQPADTLYNIFTSTPRYYFYEQELEELDDCHNINRYCIFVGHTQYKMTANIAKSN